MASATGRQLHLFIRLIVLTMFGIVVWPSVSLMAQSGPIVSRKPTRFHPAEGRRRD